MKEETGEPEETVGPADPHRQAPGLVPEPVAMMNRPGF